MANRQAVKSNVLTKIQPTVVTAIHREVLNEDFADNLVFREDVAVIQTSTVTSITCDFTGKDRIDLTRTGGALSITLSGLGDGDVKYLLVTKTAGQAVTFVGTTDVTPIKANANALSTVLYEIVRKSSFYFAKAWVENVKTATDTIEGVLETATQAESNALSAVDKIVTPGRMPLAEYGQRGVAQLAHSEAVDIGERSPTIVIPYEVKRKYDESINYAAGLNTAMNGRVSTLEANTGNSALVLSGSSDANFSSIDIRGNRFGKSFSITGSFVAADIHVGVYKYLKTIDGYVSPGYDHYFVLNSTGSILEQSVGLIDINGSILVAIHKGGSQTWIFQANPIGL